MRFCMCGKCLRTEQPDRGNSVMERGCYMVNFRACAACPHVSPMLAATQVVQEDTEHSTTVVFVHACAGCGHEVARHTYRFRCTATQHLYAMECDLCGVGEDEQGTAAPSPCHVRVFTHRNAQRLSVEPRTVDASTGPRHPHSRQLLPRDKQRPGLRIAQAESATLS